MRRVIITTISLICVFMLGCQRDAGRQVFQSKPEVAIVEVRQQRIERTTELPGRTSAYLVAEIRPQVNGIILERRFLEGSDVKAGQLLYQIDPLPFRAAYDSAKASLARAKANLPSIQARAERYHALLADQAVTQQEFDDAEAARQQVVADINYWKAMVKSARINLKYTRVPAPISGRIGRSSVTDGALVTAHQPTSLAVIQQLDPIYIDVTQSSVELLRLRRHLTSKQISKGDDWKKVQVVMEDGELYPLEGKLEFRDVTVDPTTSSFLLRIVVPNPDKLLLPGMFVRAIVREGVSDRTILVPQQGVTRNPKGEAVALIVDKNNTVQQRLLKVDRAVGSQWIVTTGLAPGDRLIVEGMQKVRPGVVVKATTWGDAGKKQGQVVTNSAQGNLR